MEGQPISVEALERPVEENRPPPNPVEGAGTGPIIGPWGRPGWPAAYTKHILCIPRYLEVSVRILLRRLCILYTVAGGGVGYIVDFA